MRPPTRIEELDLQEMLYQRKRNALSHELRLRMDSYSGSSYCIHCGIKATYAPSVMCEARIERELCRFKHTGNEVECCPFRHE